MDWEKIYGWLEQKSGVSYDPNEDLGAIQGDTAFTDTFTWGLKITFILDDMASAIETVEEYRSELTEDLPPRDKLEKGIKEHIIRHLAENINSVKRQLGMSITPIDDEEDVLTNATTLRDLIMTLSSLSIEELQKRDWFETYDEETDGALTESLELHKNDLTDIHQTIETILESDDYDDDDEDEMDMDIEDDE